MSNSGYDLASKSDLYGNSKEYIDRNPKKSWGVGIAYSYTFGDPLLFPVFVYNQTFTQKWGIEALLPFFFIRSEVVREGNDC